MMHGRKNIKIIRMFAQWCDDVTYIYITNKYVQNDTDISAETVF